MQRTPSRRAVLKLLSVAPQTFTLSGFAAQSPLQDAVAKTASYHGDAISLALPNEGGDWLPGSVMSLLLRFRASSNEATGEIASLEIVALGDIFDVCINGNRTAIHRAASLDGDRLFLFAADGDVTLDSLELRPLNAS